MDQYFPAAACFNSFESYTSYHNHKHFFNYLTICSPNQHHFEQICWGIKHGANIICEKPLVIDPTELNQLMDLEERTGRKINTILQLRLHPAVTALKNLLSAETMAKKHEVSIHYITARGNWYFNSWKGREQESGGILTNIGIHLFDLLIWLFGNAKGVSVDTFNRKKSRGSLELERATVNWSLSIDELDLPPDYIASGKRYYRQLLINGQSYKLDEGMEDLHTSCYREILAGHGPGIADAAPSIILCHTIRKLATQLR
jgi:UDP-N-acetyl-2-amino-2-deoxyglucuronate dehydrogenase